MARRADQQPPKLDWHHYHLLENLLVFCTVKARQVPEESGVRFHLRPARPERSICLLFHIDRAKDPLIRDRATPRPDYAVLYVHAGLALCTIIEMKSTAQKNLSHGVDQIKALRDILRQEIKTHLPGRFKPKFQGVLLHAPNADIPRRKIEDEARRGFVIYPVLAHHSADLTYYTTTELLLTSKAPKATSPYQQPAAQWNLIEQILIHQAVPRRIQDDFYQRRFPAATPPAEREGLYINYRCDPQTHAAWTVHRTGCAVGIRDAGHGPWPAKIESWLKQAKLDRPFVPILKIP